MKTTVGGSPQYAEGIYYTFGKAGRFDNVDLPSNIGIALTEGRADPVRHQFDRHCLPWADIGRETDYMVGLAVGQPIAKSKKAFRIKGFFAYTGDEAAARRQPRQPH